MVTSEGTYDVEREIYRETFRERERKMEKGYGWNVPNYQQLREGCNNIPNVIDCYAF